MASNMNKYYKNFIMCGVADYHCLLCEETFTTTDEVEKHIRWENHRRIIKNQAYVSKFHKDRVYKIGNRFYCELCNVVTFNVGSTTDHIKDSLHALNKETPKLGQALAQAQLECNRDTGFVIVEDIILSTGEWNAIVDNHCLICDVDVHKFQLDIHVKGNDHIIKLIQAKVVKENEDRCYRKITPDNVFCFICKMIVPTQVLSAHWDEEEHIKNIELSINRTSKYTSARNQQKETMRKLMEIQNLRYDINVRAGKATCKLCEKVVELRFTEMTDHQAGHADDSSDKSDIDEPKDAGPEYILTSSDEEEEVVFSNVTDHGKRRSEVAKYGKRHNIRLNQGGSKGYCYVCHTQLSAHLQTFKQHIRGSQHRGHLELKGLKKETTREQPNYTTKSLNEYLQSVFYSPSMQLLWINAEYCVEKQSFLLVAPLKDVAPTKKVMCHVCNIQYDKKDNENHFRTAQHKTNVVNTKIIATIQREFIREIRPNLYHCGFCNRLIAYYDNVLRHFKYWIHRNQRINKDLSSRIAQQCIKDGVLTTFSTNPDVMYLQLMTQGCFVDC